MNEDVGKTVVLWDCVSLLEEFKKNKNLQKIKNVLIKMSIEQNSKEKKTHKKFKRGSIYR